LMAFVSKIGPGKKIGRYPGKKFISIWKQKSGSTGGFVTKDTGLRSFTVDIQIDEDTKVIRIGKADKGIKVNSKNGLFSCSAKVSSAVGKQKISLSDGGDGWWYGSYAGDAQEEAKL
ncbi:TPA: hypothetical protein ACSTL5_005077, partial [Serratia fonticola]